MEQEMERRKELLKDLAKLPLNVAEMKGTLEAIAKDCEDGLKEAREAKNLAGKAASRRDLLVSIIIAIGPTVAAIIATRPS